MTNNLITRYDARDYIKGDGHIVLSGVGINDWTPYFHFKELQKIGGFESDDCVIFSASEITDAEIDYLISVGKISQTTIDWFTSLGFMDSVNSDDGKPHFHSSPRYWGTLTGNGQNGNALQDPWNVGRKYGAIPWTDLPFDATITTPEQYFAPIPQNLLDKGQQFLMGVGGKNWIQFHWLYNDANGTISFPSLDADRFATPLQIGLNVGSDWNEVSPPVPPVGSPAGHSVTNIASSAQGEVIFDHYVPYVKTLGAGYPIPQVMQAVITITPPPPAPPAPVITNDTPAQAQQATSNWLSQLVAWLSSIIGSTIQGIKGRNK